MSREMAVCLYGGKPQFESRSISLAFLRAGVLTVNTHKQNREPDGSLRLNEYNDCLFGRFTSMRVKN